MQQQVEDLMTNTELAAWLEKLDRRSEEMLANQATTAAILKATNDRRDDEIAVLFKKLADHDGRLRRLETRFAGWVGAGVVIGAVVGSLVSFAINWLARVLTQ